MSLNLANNPNYFRQDFRISTSVVFTLLLIIFEFYSQYWLLDRKIVHYASIGVIGFVYRVV